MIHDRTRVHDKLQLCVAVRTVLCTRRGIRITIQFPGQAGKSDIDVIVTDREKIFTVNQKRRVVNSRETGPISVFVPLTSREILKVTAYFFRTIWKTGNSSFLK